MNGDTAAASTIFEKYLGGEPPEKISLSRCHVREKHNQSRGDGRRRRQEGAKEKEKDLLAGK
jgi:hypothetical protein